jgi:hypothetical protein
MAKTYKWNDEYDTGERVQTCNKETGERGTKLYWSLETNAMQLYMWNVSGDERPWTTERGS